MPDKDENKPLVQLGKAEQRRNGAPSSGAPTVYNVKDPADAYAWYLNNGEVIDDKGNVVEKKPEILPVTPKATPMGVVDENGVDDNRYKTGMDYLRGISGDAGVISPEKEQRRLRRMRTASAIGNLGNVMSAFANLYYTGKGAPSQKVPDAVIPPYMQFVDRVNQARKNAEAMQMQRDRLAADAEYKQEQIRLKEKAEERQQAYYDAKIDKMIKEGNLTDLRAEKERIDIEMRIEENPLKLDKLRKEAQRIQATIDNITARTNKTNLEAGGKTVETTDDGDGNKTVVTTYGSGGAKPAAQASSQSVSQTQTNTSGKKSTGITNWK